ncbi:MAG: hypothetical protein Q7S19_01015 [bacterium]|nr:hypothetical protein [bacterium]
MPKNVLILGCGACCAIDSVLKLWSVTEIDALDYDPLIVDIGKKIYGNFKGKKVNLFMADAEAFINESKKKYDLILIDLFHDAEPSPLLKNQQFLSNLKRIIRDGGTIIANLATIFRDKDEETFRAWNTAFLESFEVKYYGNRLNVFVNKNIPSDYYNMHQSAPYAESLKGTGLDVVGKPEEYYYIQHLPFKTAIITAMHTDVEPDIEFIRSKSGIKHGLIIWSPWRKTFTDRPWRKLILPPLHVKGNGMAFVVSNYQDKWNQTARRDLKKFERSGVEMRSVSREEFVSGLMTSLQKSSVKSMFKGMIERLQNAQLHFWLAEKEGKVLSGLAVMDYSNISVHLAAFTSDSEEGTYSGTGLIDHWYQYALKKGIKYLNFGHIRQYGETKAWQGYSDFKRKFLDKEIVIRNQYFRFF